METSQAGERRCMKLVDMHWTRSLAEYGRWADIYCLQHACITLYGVDKSRCMHTETITMYGVRVRSTVFVIERVVLVRLRRATDVTFYRGAHSAGSAYCDSCCKPKWLEIISAVEPLFTVGLHGLLGVIKTPNFQPPTSNFILLYSIF